MDVYMRMNMFFCIIGDTETHWWRHGGEVGLPPVATVAWQEPDELVNRTTKYTMMMMACREKGIGEDTKLPLVGRTDLDGKQTSHQCSAWFCTSRVWDIDLCRKEAHSDRGDTMVLWREREGSTGVSAVNLTRERLQLNYWAAGDEWTSSRRQKLQINALNTR